MKFILKSQAANAPVYSYFEEFIALFELEIFKPVDLSDNF